MTIEPWHVFEPWHIFLDLEETVIVDWHEDRTLINIDKLERFFNQLPSRVIHLYSFAIYNEEDLRKSQSLLKNIEEFYGINIEHPWTMDEILSTVSHFMKYPLEQLELAQVLGKQRSFVEFCRAHPEWKQCVLVDDTVVNSDLILEDQRIVTCDVRKMPNIAMHSPQHTSAIFHLSPW